MAKADDTTSTSDWVWLRDALDLAAAALGSRALAKERLMEWLAAGKLPWSCMSWEGLDAASIAKLRQEFWGASLVEIDWGDNAAYEAVFVSDGARARGIKVPRALLLALLFGGPRERKQLRGAGAWVAAEASRMKAGQRDSAGHSNHRFCAGPRKANGQGRRQQPIHPSNQIDKHREQAPRPGPLANYLHQVAEAHIGRTNVRFASASCRATVCVLSVFTLRLRTRSMSTPTNDFELPAGLELTGSSRCPLRPRRSNR